MPDNISTVSSFHYHLVCFQLKTGQRQVKDTNCEDQIVCATSNGQLVNVHVTTPFSLLLTAHASSFIYKTCLLSSPSRSTPYNAQLHSIVPTHDEGLGSTDIIANTHVASNI